MNDNKLKYNIGELAHSSASHSPPPPDKQKEAEKSRKKSFVKLILIGLLLIIVIIIGSLGWFSMNRNVDSSGMNIMTSTLPFDIATKGTRIRNPMGAVSATAEYVEGTSGTLADTQNTTDTYFSDDSLLLRFSPVDDPDTEDVDESENPPDISPGSYGELSLYIIPKNNSEIKANISLNIAAYAGIEEMDAQNNKVTTMVNGEEVVVTTIVEITDQASFEAAALSVNNTDVKNEAEDYIKAADHLKTHILFFSGIGDTENATEASRYYYTSPLTEKNLSSQITFEQTVGANNKGKAVKVPIYWMWTNTFGQIALPDNISQNRFGYPILADSDAVGKAKIKQYLIDNRADFFSNNGVNTSDYINSVTTSVPKAQFNEDAFTNLSNGYNQADYAIGIKIAYFMIEVTIGAGN